MFPYTYKIFTTSNPNEYEIRIYDGNGVQIQSKFMTSNTRGDVALAADALARNLEAQAKQQQNNNSTTVSATVSNVKYTYYFAKSGFNKTITVLRNNIQIHVGPPSSTAPEDVLKNEAILALQSNIDPSEVSALQAMQRVNAPITQPSSPPPPPVPTPQTVLPPPPIIAAATSKPKKQKPAGKGIEALLTNITKQIALLENGIDKVFYGNPLKNTGVKFPGAKKKVNGILPIAQEIAKIDLCNIINYVLTNLSISDLAKNTKIAKKITALQDKAKNLLSDLENGKLTAKALKRIDKKDKITKLVKEISEGIDSDIISAAPQLAIAKNYLNDVVGSYSQYTNLNTIPNADIQRLLTKIQGIQSIATSITTLNSAQDVLNIVNKVGNTNLNKNISDLQKAIDPARILPLLKKLSNVLKNINQIGLKILNYIKIVQTITKVMKVVSKTLDVIKQILSLIPIPNIITIVAITQKFSDALQKIQKFIDTVKKRISQILNLIDLIYSFVLGLVSKIGELKAVVDTIIANLQACEKTDDTSITDLQQVTAQIANTTDRLNKFIADYTNSQANTGNQLYNGYKLSILEEEVADEGIQYKRRKAIALDPRGVLVAETPLTFANDVQVLYDELLFIMKQKGLLTNQPFQITTFLDEVGDTENDYADVGLSDEQGLLETAGDVSMELSSFIGGIKKGGKRFKRRIRQLTSQYSTQSAQKLKSDAKTGKFQPSYRTNFQSSINRTTGETSTGGSNPPGLLSASQRKFWENLANSTTTQPALKTKARKILERDKIAQQQQGGGD